MLARFGQPVAFAALRGQRVSLWLPSNFGCNELTDIYEQPTQLFITESSWHSGDCASRERDGVWRGSIDKWLGVMHMAWGGSESLRGWLGSPFASHAQDTRPDRPRLHGHPCFFSSKHPRPPVFPRSTLSTTELRRHMWRDRRPQPFWLKPLDADRGGHVACNARSGKA